MKRIGVWAIALVVLFQSAGCASVTYLSQAALGHLNVLRAARPTGDWIADPQTPPVLRSRLQLAERLRNYAVAELHLPDNASYRRYADLHRSAAVWNVVAAPELSLQLQTWCFLIVGCVGYRGYYSLDAANAEAGRLRAAGLDVNVYPVPAYSTLGKLPGSLFADPLLNTFIDEPEGELAGLIFHELAHQVAYAAGDTVFNESFATAVERIGTRRWLSAHATVQAQAEWEQSAARHAAFEALVFPVRDQLAELYRSRRTDAEKRAGKAALIAALEADHAARKAATAPNDVGYDGWFRRANNASFGVLAAYTDLVPQFERLFERSDADFVRFYSEVQRLAALPGDERRAALRAEGS